MILHNFRLGAVMKHTDETDDEVISLLRSGTINTSSRLQIILLVWKQKPNHSISIIFDDSTVIMIK